MTMISRDPFARTEVHRTMIYHTTRNYACDWCGQAPRAHRLFQYYTESDDGRRSYHKGHFCCKPCHDSYHS
jgi:hypothetical protein